VATRNTTRKGLEVNLPFSVVQNLETALEIPKDGTLSRTIYQDEQVKAVLFGFDAGQELSEHTASVPAIIQIISGQASLTLGNETLELQAGAWVHMEAKLTHAIRATSPVIMLLLMLKSGSSKH
jgi:quercetin dioxygenase-like cupin family protein